MKRLSSAKAVQITHLAVDSEPIKRQQHVDFHFEPIRSVHMVSIRKKSIESIAQLEVNLVDSNGTLMPIHLGYDIPKAVMVS